MLREQSTENQLIQAERDLIKLRIEMQALDQEIEEFFSKYPLDWEALQKMAGVKEHFTSSQWEEICQIEKTLQKKIDASFSEVKDPKKAIKSFKDFSRSRHWIFVK